jgi:DNA-binding CsgD family transcriptional regulator
MFGTEIKLTTFVFICIELIVLFFQLPNYLSRRQDKSRLRFLILILAFIFYNLCSGLFPDARFPIHILAQNILAFGSGIILATYYFYYLVKELNISQEKLFNTKVLFWSLAISFIIGFILTYTFTGSIRLSKRNFIILPVLISIYFCITTVKFLTQKRRKQVLNETPFKIMVYSGYIGIIFMASMPVVVFFGDYQTINNGLVNISFIITFYAYINYYLFQSKVEYNLLQKAGFFGLMEVKKEVGNTDNEKLNDLKSSLLEKSGLTSRELDIAYLILKDMTYDEIALETYITPKTVSKHASNIYKKTDSDNKRDFIRKFKSEKIVIRDFNEKNENQLVT